MTDELNTAQPASTDPAPPRAGRSFGPYVAIAAICLAVGAAAMYVALGWRAAEHAPSPAATAAVDRGSNGVPPVDPPSAAAVYISPARQQLIGVRTATVSEQSLDATIRTAGVLAYDETRVAEVHTKVAGWIDRVSVDFVGKAVRRGEPLFSVYSPDLVATQKEYLLALKAQKQLGESRFEETRSGASSLLEAARERLRLWDFTDAQIAELERTGEPKKMVTVYSPFDGIVLERNAFPGQYITPEARTFRIADLSTIWAVAQVFEAELSSIRIGQTAEIEFPYGQARTIKGRITYIHPDIDPMTRRGRVRIEFRNPGLEFKPESYVTVMLRTGGGRRLAVPTEAVIDTGDRQYAILALADGFFEPRSIQIGSAAGNYYPVIDGLRAGDRVVTSAQFLIDSETNLQAALAAMSAPVSEQPNAAPAPPSAAAPSAPTTGKLDIALRSQPDPPRTGQNDFEVTVKDAAGQPIADAEVTVTFSMPAMPSMGMPAMRIATTLSPAGAGVYRGMGQVIMAGRWDVSIVVTRGGARLGSRQLAVVAK